MRAIGQICGPLIPPVKNLNWLEILIWLLKLPDHHPISKQLNPALCQRKPTKMSEISETSTHFAITERAARRIASIMGAETEGSMLRVSVSGGGCSGFQYKFTFDHTRNGDDLSVERDGVVVLVDSVSLPFVEGSTLDFVDDLMGQSFRVSNPNATAACGCGTSFSIS
jgi:iron-sulfur cluster assembly accessory protein